MSECCEGCFASVRLGSNMQRVPILLLYLEETSITHVSVLVRVGGSFTVNSPGCGRSGLVDCKLEEPRSHISHVEWRRSRAAAVGP